MNEQPKPKQGFKISSKNKELLDKKGVTIADIENQAKNNTPATIVTGSGDNKTVTDVADTEEEVHKFESDEERQEYMKSLAEQKKYYVGVKQKRYHKTLLTLGFSLPARKPKKHVEKPQTVKPATGGASTSRPKKPRKKFSLFKKKPKNTKGKPAETKSVNTTNTKPAKEKAREKMQDITKQNSKDGAHHGRNIAIIFLGLLLSLAAAYYALDAGLVDSSIELPYDFIN